MHFFRHAIVNWTCSLRKMPLFFSNIPFLHLNLSTLDLHGFFVVVKKCKHFGINLEIKACSQLVSNHTDLCYQNMECIIKFADECFSTSHLWFHVQMFVIKLSLPADKLIFFFAFIAHIWSHIDFFLLIFFAYSLAQISTEKACQLFCLFYFLWHIWNVQHFNLFNKFEWYAFFCCLWCVRSMQSLVWNHWYVLTYSLIRNSCSFCATSYSVFESQLLIKLLCNRMSKKKLVSTLWLMQTIQCGKWNGKFPLQTIAMKVHTLEN